MNRILTTLTAAAALGGAAMMVPTTASANPLVIAPVAAAAILGGTAVTGVAVGAAVSHPYANPAYPSGYAAAAPVEPSWGAPGCYFTNTRIRGVWHKVQVCD